MKVLLLYKDASHAQPLRAIHKELRSRGVDIIESHNTRSLQNTRDKLHIKADLLVVYAQLMEAAIKYEHGPILMVDRIDGAQLAQARPWMDYPNVVGVMKGYRFKPARLNNKHRGRYSAFVLKQTGVLATKKSMVANGEPSQLSAEALKRIYLMYGFAAYGHLDGCVNQPVDMRSRRRYDIHFLATMTYSGSEIETHRRMALEQMRQWQGPVFGSSGHRVQCGTFRTKMAQSHTVISPWGCGEACHRDYEAWLLGAVLIKPNTDYVECWGPQFKTGDTYIECRPDFSDLHRRVQWVKDNWRDLLPMRERCRQMVLESRNRDYMATRMAGIFHAVMP